MMRVFRVDFDFVAAIGWLAEVDIAARGGAFGDEMAGGLGGEFSGADAGVVGDGLVDSVVSVLRVLFLRVDLEIVGPASVLESVLRTVIGGVLGSPSKVGALCALATLGDMK
jgi:hypothetical protein